MPPLLLPGNWIFYFKNFDRKRLFCFCFCSCCCLFCLVLFCFFCFSIGRLSSQSISKDITWFRSSSDLGFLVLLFFFVIENFKNNTFCLKRRLRGEGEEWKAAQKTMRKKMEQTIKLFFSFIVIINSSTWNLGPWSTGRNIHFSINVPFKRTLCYHLITVDKKSTHFWLFVEDFFFIQTGTLKAVVQAPSLW